MEKSKMITEAQKITSFTITLKFKLESIEKELLPTLENICVIT
jgi:hypothetical protein